MGFHPVFRTGFHLTLLKESHLVVFKEFYPAYWQEIETLYSILHFTLHSTRNSNLCSTSNYTLHSIRISTLHSSNIGIPSCFPYRIPPYILQGMKPSNLQIKTSCVMAGNLTLHSKLDFNLHSIWNSILHYALNFTLNSTRNFNKEFQNPPCTPQEIPPCSHLPACIPKRDWTCINHSIKTRIPPSNQVHIIL